MSRVETLLGLLRLLRASGGEVGTRIRIQKEAFLLAAVNLAGFRTSDFYFHHYGPYSRGLSDTLQYAVTTGLIREERETSEDLSFTKYRYHLTESGRQLIDGVGPEERSFSELVGYLSERNWRALELAATVRFLETAENVQDRKAAFAQALALKPATAPFKQEAEDVLEQVRKLRN